jgi:hypothetical protein
MAQIATIDTLRSVGYAAITSSYTAVGTPAIKPIHILIINNTTDADMLISDDGVTNKLIVPKLSYLLLDVSANRDGYNPPDVMEFPQRTQYYVKYVGAPSLGTVYIAMIYGS